MGGARMHRDVSGCGGPDLVADDTTADRGGAPVAVVTFPTSWRSDPPTLVATAPVATAKPIATSSSRRAASAYDIRKVITTLVDDGSFFEFEPLFAKELVAGFARLDGQAGRHRRRRPDPPRRGAVQGQLRQGRPLHLAVRTRLRRSLLFLAGRARFMMGSKVEREGIIRHGAKMITAVAEATVPKIGVIVRKAYGASLAHDVRSAVRSRRLPRAPERAVR